MKDNKYTVNGYAFDCETNVLPYHKAIIIPGFRDEYHADATADILDSVPGLVAGPCTDDGGKTWGVYVQRVKS